MTVREIVKKYLLENGYDGLANNCYGCNLENLIQCNVPCEDCEAGYRVLVKDLTLEEKRKYGIDDDYKHRRNYRFTSVIVARRKR